VICFAIYHTNCMACDITNFFSQEDDEALDEAVAPAVTEADVVTTL